MQIPNFIDQDLTPYDLAAIIQGGCESGAYMPAVTYHKAMETMSEHGDDVFTYIEERLGELPTPKEVTSWSGLACFYVSYAVELWAIENEDKADWENDTPLLDAGE